MWKVERLDGPDFSLSVHATVVQVLDQILKLRADGARNVVITDVHGRVVPEHQVAALVGRSRLPFGKGG